MACKEPLVGYQLHDGTIAFNEGRTDYARQLQLACGQCAGCRLERTRQWATRIMNEASLYEANSFVTLTYDNIKKKRIA